MVGDGETAALISRDGSVDWLCWPRFDSDACFAALLGTEENGRWRITPADGQARVTRRYRDGTLVLETEFETPSGAVRLVDFMPIRSGPSYLVRLVQGLRGRVRLRLDFAVRFDYGYLPPWVESRDGELVAVVGPDLVVLRGPVLPRTSGEVAEFSVGAGEELPFVLAYGPSHEAPPPGLDTRRALEETQTWWRDWSGRFKGATRWPEAVSRSLVTLKALIYRPTGGLVAAPTTSLPEVAGGAMNWDYRYCWLRDATFTLGALLDAGYHEEAARWRDWILRAVGGAPERMRIMYRVDGDRHLFEWEVPWLAGHGGARPVRVGNDAAAQKQLDVYGELLDMLHLSTRAGIEPSPRSTRLETELVTQLEEIWPQPGHGIWEERGEPGHFTYSKAMAWVGVDRYLRGAAARGPAADPDLLRRLEALRARIHAEVCSKGYDEARGHFVQRYGGEALDASLLLLPLVGFLPVEDPRVRGTIAAVERDLVEGGLVRREAAGGREGAFVACSCWMADCLALQGRRDEARALFERVLALRNDVGLLSEEYDVRRRRMAGNFPQALSHLAVVNTALSLCGPVLRRGGE